MILRFAIGFIFGVLCLLLNYREEIREVFDFRKSPLIMKENIAILRIFLLICAWVMVYTNNPTLYPWVMFAVILSLLDMREGKIHLGYILLMIAISYYFKGFTIFSALLPITFIVLKTFINFFTKKNNLGFGDILLSIGAGCFMFEFIEVANFILLTGLFALGTYIFLQGKETAQNEIPLVPAIMLSTWCIINGFYFT